MPPTDPIDQIRAALDAGPTAWMRTTPVGRRHLYWYAPAQPGVWDEPLYALDPDAIRTLLSRLESAEARVGELEKEYYELVMQVGNKHAGESRHETALRYIRQAEQSSSEAGAVQAIDAAITNSKG